MVKTVVPRHPSRPVVRSLYELNLPATHRIVRQSLASTYAVTQCIYRHTYSRAHCDTTVIYNHESI
jgi:hypothetical protein